MVYDDAMDIAKHHEETAAAHRAYALTVGDEESAATHEDAAERLLELAARLRQRSA